MGSATLTSCDYSRCSKVVRPEDAAKKWLRGEVAFVAGNGQQVNATVEACQPVHLGKAASEAIAGAFETEEPKVTVGEQP